MILELLSPPRHGHVSWPGELRKSFPHTYVLCRYIVFGTWTYQRASGDQYIAKLGTLRISLVSPQVLLEAYDNLRSLDVQSILYQ